MKNVLIISSSLRAKSNSEALAHCFEKGASDAGNKVDFVSLKGKQIAFCKGCLACQIKKDGHCVIKDDSDEIVQKMLNADVICFATPIYYEEMSGQLKTLLDRGNPMYQIKYKFRDIYFLTVSAVDSQDEPKRAINGIEGWIDCFDEVSLVGTIHAGGINLPDEIENNEVLAKAYEMGRNV